MESPAFLRIGAQTVSLLACEDESGPHYVLCVDDIPYLRAREYRRARYFFLRLCYRRLKHLYAQVHSSLP